MNSKELTLLLMAGVSIDIERGSSAVECRNRNGESPGSYNHPFATVSFYPRRPSSLGCKNEYLAIKDSGGTTE